LFNPPSDGSGETSSFKNRHAAEQYSEWCNDLPRYIIPRICLYYRLHPDCFKPTGHGEEIEIEGFAEFVKNDSYFKSGHRASVWAGRVRDPWGDPLLFVEDLDLDGYIEASGERRIVFEERLIGQVEFTNRDHHFGILKQVPFKGPFGNRSERIVAMTFATDGYRR
jgi:hypothetical protein